MVEQKFGLVENFSTLPKDRYTMSSEASVFHPDYDSTVGKGTAVVQVADKTLAACLLAVGIRLRKDPPYLSVRKSDGKVTTVFNFLPSCDEGKLKTTEMIAAWKKDLQFIKDFPMHPFTFAMCAIRNYQDILEHVSHDTPFVAFKARSNGKPATLLVKEGSKKHEAAVKRGLVRI